MNHMPTTHAALRPLAVTTITICGVFCIALLAWASLRQPAYNNDFLGLYSFARFIRNQPAADIGNIYNDTTIAAFQHQLFPAMHGYYSFPYPPSFLLAINWLGDLPYVTARIMWMLSGLTLLALSVWLILPAHQRVWGVLAVLVSPASFFNAIGGETGYFTAALLVAGFAILPKRPVLAGLAFGLLTLKPQIGILVPLVLLAQWRVRAMLSAFTTAILLFIAAIWLYPPGAWFIWLQHLGGFQSQELSHQVPLTSLMVTVTAGLLILGASLKAASIAQLIAASLCAAITVISFRALAYREAVGLALLGSLLATPHAYVYDAIPIIIALFLLAETSCITWAFIALGFILYVSPLLTLTPASGDFVYALPVAFLYGLSIRHGFATQPALKSTP
jgi:hypothetical protein